MVPFGPLCFRVPLLKPNSRNKGYPSYNGATQEARSGVEGSGFGLGPTIRGLNHYHYQYYSDSWGSLL